MNSIYKIGVRLMAVVVAMTFMAACSSDDDGYSVPGAEHFTRDMIIGEWYQPVGEGNYGIGHYMADGTLTSTNVIATKSGWSYSVSEGYWDYSDGIVSYVMNSQSIGLLNTTTKADEQIIKLTKYELQSSSLNMDLVSGGYRIVDTYQMNVGETRQAIINDSEFKPQEYSSVSYHVAGVDDEGTIEARHLGTTYILVKSSIGTAVIRVVVNDSANAFDEVLQILGLPLKAITKEYGTTYIEKVKEDGTVVRHYNLPDDKVMDIRLETDAGGYVNIIQQFFSNNITPDEVRAALSRKYDFQGSAVDESEGPYSVYTTTWQCRRVNVLYFEKPHQLLVAFQDGHNYLAKYDDFFNYILNRNFTLSEVADMMNYTLTDADKSRFGFTTRAPYPFYRVDVMSNPQGYVYSAKLYFDDHVTFHDTEYYINRYYYPTSYQDTFFSLQYSYVLQYQESEDGYLQFFLYTKF